MHPHPRRCPPPRASRALTRAALALALLCAPFGAAAGQQAEAAPDRALLLAPGAAAFDGAAPDTFRVRFETSKGAFVVEVVRDWAPRGSDRFYHLVRSGFYDDVRFYRAVEGYMVQFGLNGDPAVTAAWQDHAIPDDPVRFGNERGRMVFASAGPDTRTTVLFVNLQDNPNLDGLGFAPFGRVVQGMEVVDRLYTGYGETPPFGSGPRQDRIMTEGNAYLTRLFPALDHVVRASVVQGR